ncbi:MAG: hypothetical protein AABY22_07450, partial [Nanoarchaeota archaeon]
ESFAEGLFKSLQSGVESRASKNKPLDILELMLKQSQMESLAQQRKTEQENLNQLIQQRQISNQSLGANDPFVKRFPDLLGRTRGESQQIIPSLIASETKKELDKSLKPKVYLREVGNDLVKINIDPSSGEVLSESPIGLSSRINAKLRDSLKDFTTADNLLINISDLTNKVLTVQKGGFSNLPQLISQGGKITLDSLSKKDPNAVSFLRAIDAFSSLITRGLGEKGVLTTQDVQRVIKALPGRFDTIESAINNLSIIRGILDGAKEASIKSYTSPLEQLTGKSKVPTLQELKAERAKRNKK